jgi:hypothetical protein
VRVQRWHPGLRLDGANAFGAYGLKEHGAAALNGQRGAGIEHRIQSSAMLAISRALDRVADAMSRPQRPKPAYTSAPPQLDQHIKLHTACFWFRAHLTGDLTSLWLLDRCVEIADSDHEWAVSMQSDLVEFADRDAAHPMELGRWLAFVFCQYQLYFNSLPIEVSDEEVNLWVEPAQWTRMPLPSEYNMPDERWTIPVPLTQTAVAILKLVDWGQYALGSK